MFAIFANLDFARNFPPAKIISTANGISRNCPPRENKILIEVYASIICNKNGAFVHITNSSLIVGITGIRNVVKPSGFFFFLNWALCFSSVRYRNDLDSKW